MGRRRPVLGPLEKREGGGQGLSIPSALPYGKEIEEEVEGSVGIRLSEDQDGQSYAQIHAWPLGKE